MRQAVVMLWIGALALMVVGVAMVPDRTDQAGFSRGNGYSNQFAPGYESQPAPERISYWR